VEAVRADLGWHIANPRQADVDAAHADADGAFRQVAIAIAAVFIGTLLTTATQELVNFGFKRRFGASRAPVSRAHRQGRARVPLAAEPDTV
jgi:hypothetical protein